MSRITSTRMLLVLFLVSSSVAYAQLPTGVIEGTITDASGAIVPNASITITNKATGVARDLKANSGGLYSAPALNAGDYEVKVELTGFKTVVQSATVTAGGDVMLNFTLSVGAQTDVVTVEASAVQLNTESNTVQGDIERATIQDIPLNGRSFMQLASLEPGVTIAAGSTAQFNALFTVSVLGGTNRTVFTIDGGNISDNVDVGGGITSMNFSQDVIQEFQLSAVAFDLSTPVAIGGAINIVSRSGSNEFHGSGYFFFRDHNTAAYPNLVRTPSDPNPFFVRRNPGVTASGPIKKNRLFFFTNFEYLNQVQAINIATTGPSLQGLQGTYSSPYDYKQFTVRFDYHINEKNNLFVRYSHDGNAGFAQSLEFGDPSNWAHNTNWADQSIMGLTTTLTPNIVNDFRFQYNYWNNHNLPANASDCSLPCVGGIPNVYTFIGTNFPAVGNNFNAPQGRNTRRFETVENVSWQKGTHRIRFGADFNPTSSNGYWGFCAPLCVGAFTQEFLVGTLGPALAATFYPNVPKTLTNDAQSVQLPVYNGNSSIFSGVGVGNTATPSPYGYSSQTHFDQYRTYVQDTWKVKPDLTVNYGLAWNAQIGFYNSNLQKPAYLAPILGANSLGPTVNNLTEFQPAFGFNWSPFKDHKTVIRGGGGIYWDGTPGYYKYRDASAIGPPGNGRSTLSASAFTNNIPGIINFSAGGVPIPIGAPLPIGALTTMTVQQFINTVTTELPAISAILAPANPITSGPYPYSAIDYAKQGVEIYPEHYPLARSYQTNLGLQRELPYGFLLTADWARRQGENIALGEIDQNLYNRFEGSSTPVPVIPLCNPNQFQQSPSKTYYLPGQQCSTGSITVWNGYGRSNYNGLLTRVQKRYSNHLFVQVSYAYQHAYTLSAWNDVNFNQGWGQYLGHNNLNGTAYYDLRWGFQISLNSLTVSPTPATVTVSTNDLILPGTVPAGSTEPLPGLPYGCVNNGCDKAQIQAAVNGFNTIYVAGGLLNAKGVKYTPLILPPNYSLGKWIVSQDIRLTKTFRYKERYTLAIMAEGFNILNISNLVAPTLTVDPGTVSNGTVVGPGTYAFGQYTQRVGQSLGQGGPRAFQFGARLSFN